MSYKRDRQTRFPSPLAGEGGRSECSEDRPGEGLLLVGSRFQTRSRTGQPQRGRAIRGAISGLRIAAAMLHPGYDAYCKQNGRRARHRSILIFPIL